MNDSPLHSYFFRGNFLFFLIVLVMIQSILDCGPASGLSRLSGLVALASRRPPVTRHISSKWPRAMFFYDYHWDQVVAGSRLQNLELPSV